MGLLYRQNLYLYLRLLKPLLPEQFLLQCRFRPPASLLSQMQYFLLLLQPLKVGDNIIGGLGISGGTGEEDNSLAEYGLQVLNEVL